MRIGWISIAIGLSLQAWRRVVVLDSLYRGDVQSSQIASSETVALILSAFICLGVATIGPYFRSLEENFKLRQESERKYRAIADLTFDWEYWLDANLAYIYISPSCSSICGYTSAEIMNDPQLMDQIICSEYLPSYKQSLSTILGIHEPIKEILKLRKKDGETRTVTHIALAAVIDGEFCGIRGSFTDITEAQKAKQEVDKLNQELEQRVHLRTKQLQDANKDLEAFVYSISHDLRAPLRHMNGYARAITEDYSDKLDADGSMMLSRISSAATEMNSLIEGLLRLSRVARKDLEKEWVNASELALAVIDGYKETMHDRTLITEIESDIWLFADQALLNNVLINLIDNSIKFSSRKDYTVVKLCSYCEEGCLGFSIADNSIGFANKDREKLFKVFSRLHASSDYQGTGVGLATISRIVQRHEGQIWAESEEGESSKFYILFPTPQSLGIEDSRNVADSA